MRSEEHLWIISYIIVICYMFLFLYYIDIELDLIEDVQKQDHLETALAQIIHAECSICPDSEKYKVGSVVLNRIDSELFPNTIDSVLNQRGQFAYTNLESTRISCIIAKELLEGRNRNYDVLYFAQPTAFDTTFVNWILSDSNYVKEIYHIFK